MRTIHMAGGTGQYLERVWEIEEEWTCLQQQANNAILSSCLLQDDVSVRSAESEDSVLAPPPQVIFLSRCKATTQLGLIP